MSFLKRQRVIDAEHPIDDEDDTSKQISSTTISLALHIASSLGQTEQVRHLLQAGYLVHVRDYAGHTPLFLAARNGHEATVQVLRSAGAHLASDEVNLASYILDADHTMSHLANQADVAKRRKSVQIWEQSGLDVERYKES